MQDDSVKSIRARQALYGLLSQLFLAAPDKALIGELRELPGFAEHIDRPADELAVEYERIFGRNVYPYESLYVERELMLNGAAADRVAELYAAAGYAPAGRAAGAPDHLGLELGLMAHLLGRGEAALAGRCLGEHLAAWAPICLRAVARVADHPLYLAVAALTTELILSDLPPLSRSRSERERGPGGEGLQIPLAEGDEPGLSQVVRRLVTPVEVGVFLSRADIAGLGRRLELPSPIGERFVMLRGLFEAAGQFELVPDLLAALDELLAGEQSVVTGLVEQHPSWAGHARLWQERLSAGRALLAEMRAQTRDL